jgi:hypothetical protein
LIFFLFSKFNLKKTIFIFSKKQKKKKKNQMAFHGGDVDQDKSISDFQRNRLNTPEKLRNSKMDLLWNERNTPGGGGDHDSDSEISDSDNFLTKGAFLLTPSHELSMDRAAMICDKMNFRGCFSIVKTATGILFKFSHPEDYQAVYRKGFHKVQVSNIFLLIL